jgi:hypothetical protein
MFRRHASHLLARYADGDLSRTETDRIDRHLAVCDRCRTELEEIRFAAGLVRRLTLTSPPLSVWHGIERGLDAPNPVRRFLTPAWAVAGLVLVLLAGTRAYITLQRPAAGLWEVASLSDGVTRRMAAGDWIETRDGSPARIIVGDIGRVDVAPGSRVRLGEVGAAEYRLSLARGTIEAQIDAPPRLFIVDTPASTVVDLGCAYTLSVSDDGTGELRMTEGWVALEWQGRESLVPAGAIARTRGAVGPGLPYFEDASVALKGAVDAFDRRANGEIAVETIVAEARVRDTLTLWHLLSRVDSAQRTRVYERLAALVAPPPTVSRDAALQLDADALRMLREELAWHW